MCLGVPSGREQVLLNSFTFLVLLFPFQPARQTVSKFPNILSTTSFKQRLQDLLLPEEEQSAMCFEAAAPTTSQELQINYSESQGIGKQER